MYNENRFRILIHLAFMIAAVLGYGSLATAANDPPDLDLTFPSGIACAGFDLHVEGWNGTQHSKEFSGKDGLVRILKAGKGSELLFTNLSTGKTFSTKSNGSVSSQRYNLDGSYTETDTGHNVIILFPTDNPPGPSTTLIVGRIVFTVDTSGNFTVQEENGKITDICAEVH